MEYIFLIGWLEPMEVSYIKMNSIIIYIARLLPKKVVIIDRFPHPINLWNDSFLASSLIHNRIALSMFCQFDGSKWCFIIPIFGVSLIAEMKSFFLCFRTFGFPLMWISYLYYLPNSKFCLLRFVGAYSIVEILSFLCHVFHIFS